MCAKFESELAELDPPDRKEMLESVGLKEPAAVGFGAAVRTTRWGSRVISRRGRRKSGRGPCRWGRPAAGAGGDSTDFERGFIRAEVYTLDDLETHKSESAIRSGVHRSNT